MMNQKEVKKIVILDSKHLLKKSNLCDYSDAYIFVKGTITVPSTAVAGAAVNNTNKKVILKNCVLFTDCTTEINNTQIDEAQITDVVMPLENLIEYSVLIWRHQEVFGNTIGMNQLEIIMVILLIFLTITIIVLHSNLKKNTRTNRKRLHKRCLNNGSIQISK